MIVILVGYCLTTVFPCATAVSLFISNAALWQKIAAGCIVSMIVGGFLCGLGACMVLKDRL